MTDGFLTWQDFDECLTEMSSFRSFKHCRLADSLTLDDKSIRLYFTDLASAQKQKEDEISHNRAFQWLVHNPSYKHAFNTMFGGHVSEKWGEDFVEKYTNEIMQTLDSVPDKEYEQATLFYRQFLGDLARAQPNSWTTWLLYYSYMYLFNPDDIGWRNVGYPLLVERELQEQLNLTRNYLKNYYYDCSLELREALISEAESLNKKLNTQSIKNYSPVIRNDETSRERYFIYNIWLWFIERDLTPPSASIFSELLNIVGSSLGERSIERQLKRWRDEHWFFNQKNKKTLEDLIDFSTIPTCELILMQVKKIPWR